MLNPIITEMNLESDLKNLMIKPIKMSNHITESGCEIKKKCDLPL